MRGHIRKRGDRSWAIVVDAGFDVDTGKRRQKWISVKGTKKDAEKKLAEVVRDLDTGTLVEPSRITMSSYLDQWMRDYVATSVRPRTARGYKTIVKRLQRGSLGRIKMTGLKATHVQRYYSELLEEGLSAQTVHHHHSLLREALGQAVKWDMLAQNVMSRVTPPKVSRPEIRTLTEAEVRRIMEQAKGTDYHLPIHIALHTGLRRSEICGLLWTDVDLARNSLSVVRTMVSIEGDPTHLDEPKSQRSRRVVAFGPNTTALLRERREMVEKVGLADRSQVCARRDGGSMIPDVVSRKFNAIANACGISDVRFHDLRHTHATHLLTSGVPIHVVSARLGHASIQTTVDVYGHVLPASDVEAGLVMERRLAE